MEHAREMALVDPRLLDTLRSPPPPPPTDTLGMKVQALDDEMMTFLDRKDLDERTKVTLFNQMLQRYNVSSDRHVKGRGRDRGRGWGWRRVQYKLPVAE